MLVYQDESLEPIGYIDLDFQSDIDSRKSTSGYVFTFEGEKAHREEVSSHT